MAAPIATWVTLSPIRASVVVGRLVSSSAGATAKARPSESTTLAMFGTARDENGGTTASQATIRTEASRYAIKASPGTEISTVSPAWPGGPRRGRS